MQDHASTIAKAKASNRPLDPGYTQSGFDSWSLLEQLAKSFKRNQQTGAGSDPQPGKEEEDPFSVQIGAKRRSAINKQRLSYVAGKFESDELYNGCALCASEFLWSHTKEGWTPHAAPAIGIEQCRVLEFPPMLCDKNGKKVEDAKQICKYAWKGQKCRNPNCVFLHLSREEFLQQMEEGVNKHDPVASDKQLAAARAPSASVAAPPPVARRRSRKSHDWFIVA